MEEVATKAKITKEDIEAERNERASACGKIIKEALEQHDCELVAVPTITQAGAVTASVSLVPKP